MPKFVVRYNWGLIFFNLQNEEPPVHRICYPSMKHSEGDVIKPRDCIIVASGHRKKDLPFIAKVTAIWEDPDDGRISCHSLAVQTPTPQPFSLVYCQQYMVQLV